MSIHDYCWPRTCTTAAARPQTMWVMGGRRSLASLARSGKVRARPPAALQHHSQHTDLDDALAAAAAAAAAGRRKLGGGFEGHA